jgi:hypothetical protein
MTRGLERINKGLHNLFPLPYIIRTIKKGGIKWGNEKHENELFFGLYIRLEPITVAACSKARTVFARSNTGIVGSNPTRDMDVCVYSVFVLGSCLATGWSLVQGVLPNVLG